MAKVVSVAGAFLTQKGEKNIDVKNEIHELEQLLAATGQTSQSTLLLKKRKEMREVDESLEVMKKDHKKRMDECEERRLQFEIKQAKMREQVLRFERFIHENDAKRQRAELKTKQERKIYEEKLKEIQQLQEKIALLEVEQKSLNEELVKKSCYKAYLERIVEEGEHGYEEIAEILNRYSTLKQANQDLLAQSRHLEQEVDQLRRKVQALRTERQNLILVHTSSLQSQQALLERVRQQVKEQEEEIRQRGEGRKEVSRELSQVLQCIKNLYGRCVMTMRVTPGFMPPSSQGGSENVESELDLILTRIRDLIEISDDYVAEAWSKEGSQAGGAAGGGSTLTGGSVAGGNSVNTSMTPQETSIVSNNNLSKSNNQGSKKAIRK